MKRLILAILVLSARAPAQSGEERSFTSSIDRIERLCAKQRYKQARRLLDGVLEKHARAACVLARRNEIRALDERISFRLSCPAPDPRSLLSGDVRALDLRKGYLVIRYRPHEMEDFQKGKGQTDHASDKGFFVHPARFAGSHRVSIRGEAYPSRGSGPWINVCEEDRRGFAVIYGSPQTTLGSRKSGLWRTWTPARILGFQDGPRTVLEERHTSPGRRGKAYHVQVMVGERSIRAAYNGRVIMRAKRPKGSWGRIGIRKLTGIKEITIQGRTDGSWLRGLVGKAEEAQRAAYMKRYRPQDHLPEWLLAAAPAPAQQGG